MLQVFDKRLTVALNNAGTLEVGIVPAFRFSDIGHMAIVNNTTRYSAPDDFTLACDGRGKVTLTWLGGTLAIGTELDVGVALIDQIAKTPGSGGGGGGGDATEATLQDILTELQTPVSALAPTVPETLNGPNGVLGVKVNQAGAGTASIEALDVDELWDVVGWSLSFSAACTLTVSVDDDDATRQYAFDIPSAGIWDLDPVDFARFSGNIAEPVGFTITAGNMKGIVYVRKHV